MADSMTEWRDGRGERLAGMVAQFEEVLNKNRTGLTFLTEIMSDNQDRVRMGHENIIVLGELASYALPVKGLIEPINNPFTPHSHLGMPGVEVHPRGKWVRDNMRACIQSNAGPEIPATDVIASVILGLLADRLLFLDPSQDSFRSSLIEVYGLVQSPISKDMATYVESLGATLDPEGGEIRVKGTHGFTWHLGFEDPEVRSFSIYSSFRGGPKRLHMEDTWKFIGPCKNIRHLVAELSMFPRGLLMENWEETEERMAEEHELYSSELLSEHRFIESVSENFLPLADTVSALAPASDGTTEGGE